MGQQKTKVELFNNNTIAKITSYITIKGVIKAMVSYYDLVNQVPISENSVILQSIIKNNFIIDCAGVNDDCALCPDDAIVANNDWCLVANNGWVLLSNNG